VHNRAERTELVYLPIDRPMTVLCRAALVVGQSQRVAAGQELGCQRVRTAGASRVMGTLGDLEMAIRRELGADQIPPKTRPPGDNTSDRAGRG
jgi:hypothetical protein